MGAETAPVIAIEQSSTTWRSGMQRWKIGWRIANKGAETLQLLSVRLPHGQFKSEEQRFEPALVLNAGAEIEFHTVVRCHEPAGLVTENAFVIFDAISSEEAWRIFVRLRVVIDAVGEPRTAVELITTQKVGFSEPLM